MAALRRRRRRSAGYSTVPDPAKVGPLLREAGFIGTDDDPVVCVATFDAAGEPRSVCARYPGGWACRLRWYRDGSYALTQSFSIRLTGTTPC